jgi:integrase
LTHNADSFATTCGASADLLELAADIPSVLAASRAPSTTELYTGVYKKWMAWVREHNGIVALPATPYSVILYLMFLAKSATSYSTINLAVSAIAWGHGLAGFTTPTRSILVSKFLSGLKAKLAQPKKQKEPFLLKQMHDCMDFMDINSITDVRDTCVLLISFYGFLRFDELAHLKVKHLVFHSSHMEIFIEKTKNDQLREGNSVCIARLGSSRCPVGLTEKYWVLAKLGSNPESFIFRRIGLMGGVKSLASKNVPITYSSVRSIVKNKCEQMGLDPKKYGTHSMHAGGSSAAANAGVGDRVFQRHGRWLSVATKNGYIKDNLQAKLAVTLALK